MTNEPAMTDWQYAARHNPFDHFCFFGGVACVRGSTKIDTNMGLVPIKELKQGTLVRSVGDDGIITWVPCGKPFVKGRAALLRIVHERGEVVCHSAHLIALASGDWVYASEIRTGDALLSLPPSRLMSNVAASHEELLGDGQHYSETVEGSPGDCQKTVHLRDRPLLFEVKIDQGCIPLHSGEQEYILKRPNHQGSSQFEDTHHQTAVHQRSNSCETHLGSSDVTEADLLGEEHVVHISQRIQSLPQFQKKSDCRSLKIESKYDHEYVFSRVISLEALAFEENYYDVDIPATGNYTAEGLVHHNTGKTFTGAHFVIDMITDSPDLTGFIGANTYDQLSQVTLRELFYWLDFYRFEWISDRRPPRAWGKVAKLKTYHNTICVRSGKQVVLIFTRVLGNENPLRGLEFSWYWIDETRDTPQDTYNVIASRLREGERLKGMITTTTNGEDWVYEIFVKNNKDDPSFGFMHVQTSMSVEQGIVTSKYYDQLLKIYSKQMVSQELDAKHVNVTAFPTYFEYDANIHERDDCPFEEDGDQSPYLPIIVAMDFNLNPMSWTLGQERAGQFYWFDEIHLDTRVRSPGERGGTQAAAIELVERVRDHKPGVILAGDATSKAGQRAGAGQSDYDIVFAALEEAGINYQNLTPDANPGIRDRVNNMNVKLMDAFGEPHMWHHSRCKYLRRDLEQVGWKKGALYVLDPGPNGELTHPSDGVGYVVCAIAPIEEVHRPGVLRVIR